MSKQEQKVKEGIAPMLDEGEEVLAAIIARPRGWTQTHAGSIHIGANQQGRSRGAAADSAFPLAALEPGPGDDGEVRPPDRAGPGGCDELKVDVDVREHVEVVGKLRLQLCAKPEDAPLMAGERAGRHHEDALLQFAPRPVRILAEREVVGDRQQALWRRGESGHGRECGRGHRQFGAVRDNPVALTVR